MTSVRVLRVFTDDARASGNSLGVAIDDTGAIDRARRQAIATELGYSETIFVERATHETRVQIFTPSTELPFAGHPMVGAASLFAGSALRVPAGLVETRRDGERAWITARADWCPPFERVQLDSAAAVDEFAAPASGALQVWAWTDESAGRVRARVFAPDVGVPEDPATGSAAIRLCATLGRALKIVQGPGCAIDVRPLDGGRFELGGRVVDDGERVA